MSARYRHVISRPTPSPSPASHHPIPTRTPRVHFEVDQFGSESASLAQNNTRRENRIGATLDSAVYSYQRYSKLSTISPAQPTKASKSRNRPKKPTIKMAEPRARVARHKGQMNFSSELRLLLLAYGDPSPHRSYPQEPLPETIRVLDEIVTDFILELCHGAAQVAHHARRQKIKVDDFRFALRRDPNKLGRVQELLRMERELKEARKAFDQNDDQVAKDAGKKGAAAAAVASGGGVGGQEDGGGDGGDNAAPPSVSGTTGKKSKGKGKRAARRESDATEESVPKKRKTIG
ncbi:hypothetical protein PENSTE_c026G08103 [Penicillium steckii]|uniref:Transcription initiation factor TFIID subunit 13 n=1 Tax=Penicillium steckii TaxID=303698 RepID=A0A1V6SQV1_9EURO|nr:hypothetical protein PENSTE_c026G08103 [Penicillium steckii]